MDMKKLNLLCAVLTAAAILTGCANMDAPGSAGDTAASDNGYSDVSSEYTCKVINGFEDFADKEKYENIPIPETMTVTVGGRQITGTLSSVTPVDYFGVQPFPSLNYTFERDDGRRGSFRVTANGILDSWFDPEIRNEVAEPVSQEMRLQAAKDFFAEQVEDISPYRIDISKLESQGTYLVEFRKYIGGVANIDNAMVYVTESGEVYTYVSYMLGTVPVDTQNPFDMEKADATVTRRLDEISAKKKSQYDRVEYGSFNLTQLIILKDGRVGLLYSKTIDYITVNENGSTTSDEESFMLLVTE